MKTSYRNAIRQGFAYLLQNYPNVFVMGQGLKSPWYVSDSMKLLDKEFPNQVFDIPVSELASTGIAIGASFGSCRPILVHPRMDFMLLATDQIINHAAKWSYMFAGKARPKVTIRGVINRGGEQGAQHSQALHSFFAHIPGLRVVMPTTVSDARDLLIASVLCDDPVIYIDDRWLYEQESDLPEITPLCLHEEGPRVLCEGKDITLVGCGYSTHLCLETQKKALEMGHSIEVIDIRILNPLDITPILQSVQKTKRLCVVDGGWSSCGFASEIIANVCEHWDVSQFKTSPQRLTLPDVPAPASKTLEEMYYLTPDRLLNRVLEMLK